MPSNRTTSPSTTPTRGTSAAHRLTCPPSRVARRLALGVVGVYVLCAAAVVVLAVVGAPAATLVAPPAVAAVLRVPLPLLVALLADERIRGGLPGDGGAPAAGA